MTEKRNQDIALNSLCLHMFNKKAYPFCIKNFNFTVFNGQEAFSQKIFELKFEIQDELPVCTIVFDENVSEDILFAQQQQGSGTPSSGNPIIQLFRFPHNSLKI